MGMVRTTIVVDDRDVQAIIERYGLRSTSEAIGLALRYLAGQPMTRLEALAMRGTRSIRETP